MIDRPARGRDEDVDAAGEAAELLPDRLAAVHRQDADRERLAVAVDRLRDLDRELARRGQDEGARAAVAVARLDRAERAGPSAGRTRRSCRFRSGPRRGRRGRRGGGGIALALDVGRLLVAEGGEGGDQALVETEAEETRAVLGRRRLGIRLGGPIRCVRRRLRDGVARGRVGGGLGRHEVDSIGRIGQRRRQAAAFVSRRH